VAGQQVRFDELLERARVLTDQGERKILGIGGAPGSGKSTLARRLVEALDGQAVLVEMDGFHLAQSELERLRLVERKGAPDTFDIPGYVDLLGRIKACGPDMIYAPTFRRDLEEPIACAVPVHPDVPLVVTEGNYLLLGDGRWPDVRAELDEVWFCDPDPAVRTARLVARHVEFGKDPERAQAWVAAVDEPNAEAVERTRARADLLVPGPVLDELARA